MVCAVRRCLDPATRYTVQMVAEHYTMLACVHSGRLICVADAVKYSA